MRSRMKVVNKQTRQKEKRGRCMCVFTGEGGRCRHIEYKQRGETESTNRGEEGEKQCNTEADATFGEKKNMIVKRKRQYPLERRREGKREKTVGTKR